MKSLIALSLLSAATISQAAGMRPQTLMDFPLEISGFGGPTIELAEFNNQIGSMIGGRGGLIINGRQNGVIIGGAIKRSSNIEHDDSTYNFAHGGLLVGYVYQPKELFHAQLETVIGMGELSAGDMTDDNQSYYVSEIGITMEMNVSQFMQVGLMLHYNMFQGIDLNGLQDDDFSTPSIGVSFEFGRF